MASESEKCPGGGNSEFDQTFDCFRRQLATAQVWSIQVESLLGAALKRIAELEADARINAKMLADLHNSTVPVEVADKLRERVRELEKVLGQCCGGKGCVTV